MTKREERLACTLTFGLEKAKAMELVETQRVAPTALTQMNAMLSYELGCYALLYLV